MSYIVVVLVVDDVVVRGPEYLRVERQRPRADGRVGAARNKETPTATKGTTKSTVIEKRRADWTRWAGVGNVVTLVTSEPFNTLQVQQGTS